MHKVFIFLLAVLILVILGSMAVMAVLAAVDIVKDFIDDWREQYGYCSGGERR